MIFGRGKMTDRSTVMVVPGINDRTIIEMGDKGILIGKAKEMYDKLKHL